MRPTMLAVIPLLAAIAASPATAQINARVHIDIPIGRDQPEVIYDQRYLPPEITVYDYDRDDYGDWDVDGYNQYWQPVTVYFYLGRYFERPIRGARPFVIYRYGNRYFFPPRDVRWEQRYGRNNNWGHRDYQYRDNGYARDRGYLDQGVRARDDRSQYNGSRNYPNQVPQGQYNGSRNYPNQVFRGQDPRSRSGPGPAQPERSAPSRSRPGPTQSGCPRAGCGRSGYTRSGCATPERSPRPGRPWRQVPPVSS